MSTITDSFENLEQKFKELGILLEKNKGGENREALEDRYSSLEQRMAHVGDIINAQKAYAGSGEESVPENMEEQLTMLDNAIEEMKKQVA